MQHFRVLKSMWLRNSVNVHTACSLRFMCSTDIILVICNRAYAACINFMALECVNNSFCSLKNDNNNNNNNSNNNNNKNNKSNDDNNNNNNNKSNNNDKQCKGCN